MTDQIKTLSANPQEVRRFKGPLHFIGIGGIGMSGIAEVLHNLGYIVQGSDLVENANIQRLQALGIKCILGQSADNIDGANVVVFSSAVKANNPELKAAREKRVPVVKRSEMLAELMRLRRSIGVAGTHGKTTTTSLVGTLLHEAGYDPTVINGGIINAFGTNTRLGQSDWLVAETDESDGSFTHLPLEIGIVTNIDPEHMDHYGSFDKVKNAYLTFLHNLPFYGFAAVCIDHPEVAALIPQVQDRRLITYGLSPLAEVRIENNVCSHDGCRFDIISEKIIMRDIQLAMYGQHNVLNATAAVIVAHELGIDDSAIRRALLSFEGVKRRFTRIGVANGVTVIDDYGHHPVEIRAVLSAARSIVKDQNRIIAVVQPHRYSRLESLMDEFAACFTDADEVIVADIYAAGEQPIAGVTRDALIDGIKVQLQKPVHALNNPDDLAALLQPLAQDGDYIICLGAGTITNWAATLPEQLQTLQQQKAA